MIEKFKINYGNIDNYIINTNINIPYGEFSCTRQFTHLCYN